MTVDETMLTTTAGPRSRAVAPIIAVLVLVFASLGLIAATAQAARVHQLLVEETLPEGQTPRSVAVNQATHHFYVAVPSGGVYNFDQDGQIDTVSPQLTGAPILQSQYVAVDNTDRPTAGMVYVSGSTGSGFSLVPVVQQFDAAGAATSVTLTDQSIPADGTPQEGGLPPVVNTGEWWPRAIAVGSTGEIFVNDAECLYNVEAKECTTGAQAIDVFTSSGAFVRQIAAGQVPEGTEGIAIDSFGHIFVARNNNPVGLGPGLFELDSTTGACMPVGCEPIDPEPIKGVAADSLGGRIFTTVSGQASKVTGESRFNEYEAATGELLGITAPPQLIGPEGVAVDEATGAVIIADALPLSEGTVKLFGPLQIVPDVLTEAPTALTDRSIRLNGKVGAAGIPGATCTFQYVAEEQFQANRFEGAAEAPCTPAGPFSGTTMDTVHTDLSGLRGGTTYHERIVGTNENGSNPGEDILFTTAGPSISGTEAVAVSETGATLTGFVNPRGAVTTYRFQYVTESQFARSGFTEAVEAPPGGQAIGSGGEAVQVAERLEGLALGTTYRFRLLTTSTGGATAGSTTGPDVGFSTFAPASPDLPDARRYEQASPVQKNGANAEGEVNSVAASPDGERVTYFSSAGIPGGDGEQFFPSYLATRAPDGGGWSTQGLLPPASAGPVARVLGWTEDLAETYDFALRPFESGQLLRRASADGSLADVRVSELGASEVRQNTYSFAAASASGAVTVLEGRSGGLLPEDLRGKQNVYVYALETGRLVVGGVLNDGSVPTEGAMAGPYDWFASGNPHSEGGSGASYYTQAGHVLSNDGRRLFFTAGSSGQLYVRENPLAQQSLMSGDQCIEANVKACTVRISAPDEGVGDPGTPAAFVGASADGSLVYFLDKGKLTAAATGGTGYDLYCYDFDAPEGSRLTDLTLDSDDKDGARVQGVLGISDGGADVYFVAAGKLTPDASQAPNGETNLYASHGGVLSLIARLGTGPAETLNWLPRSRAAGNQIAARAARLSADGQTLLFRSQRDLTAYRSHGVAELYLYRTGSGLRCISCRPTGEPPLGPAGVQEIPEKFLAPKLPFAIMTRNLSSDGRRVFFDSTDRLVYADDNDVNDVYEWEANGKGSCRGETQDGGCLFLISGGAAGAEPSYFGDADPEGENIFFFTAQRLVAQDRDELIDLYDARVGGGIVAQEKMPPAPCAGEAGCLPGPPAPPVTGPAGSSGSTGPGNFKSKRCRKALVRRHGKCLRQRHRKRRHRHHARNHHGKKRHGKSSRGNGKRRNGHSHSGGGSHR